MFAACAAQTFPRQLDTVGIVHEAIQDGIGVGRVTDDFVPSGQGELGCGDRRSPTVSLLKNLEKIVTGAAIEGLEAKVVHDKNLGAAEGLDETGMAPITSGEHQFLA